MPYTDGLPFSGVTPTSRHTSYLAAKAAAPKRASKSASYLGWLKVVGSATDHEAQARFGWPMSSVCSIRNGLMKRDLVGPCGMTLGPFRCQVTKWKAL